MNVLSNIVQEVRLESAWFPPVTIAQPFADSPPSPVASAAGNFLKPAITVTLAGGGTYKSAPYGDPGPNNWPLIQIGAGVALLMLSVWLFKR